MRAYEERRGEAADGRRGVNGRRGPRKRFEREDEEMSGVFHR